MDNICLLTDSYKFSHYKQYPPKTEKVYSYFESRGGKYPYTVFFGLQYFITKYLEGQVVTQEKIDYAEERVNAHMGPGTFNREGWQYILDTYEGRLPVIIKAVPEGTVVPTRNVLMTIENTDDKCYWLTNYLETLLVQVWYPTTVATQSRVMKALLLESLERTGDPSLVDFKLHDFGFRGSTSVESAGLGGASHLTNFKGTDTFEGIEVAYKYYNEDMAGFSIPASEHSTITSWGEDGEVDAMRNMLNQYPTGLVACVSDSYDIFRACTKYWGAELKDEVLSRDGVLVVRPDSGDPPTIVCQVLRLLGDAFGYATNKKGFKILPPQIRVIQGDGIDQQMLQRILFAMEMAGWSTDNIAFGSGGGLLQKLDRDTCKFAFKCSSITVDGEEVDVWKDPVTDKGKASKRGRLKLVRAEGAHGKAWATANMPDHSLVDELQTVFLNGTVTQRESMEDIRTRTSF